MRGVRLRCRCSAEDGELVSVLLFEHGALAVAEHEGDGGIDLEAGFDSVEGADRAVRALAPFIHSPQVDDVADDWVIQQRTGLGPTTAGRWFIRAPWHDPPSALESGQIELVIDPGTAFGHGAHPTTAAALGLLDRFVDEAEHVVDVGTGTGVLAIAAASTGASASAVEVDAEAAEVARANVRRNGVETRVRVQDGDAATTNVGAPPLVLANVTIDVHRRLTSVLALATRLVLTGVVESQVDELLAMHGRHELEARIDVDGWVAVSLVRRSAED